MIELNQEYRVRPVFTTCKSGDVPIKVQGKVVYIHPRGRYVVLEFDDGAGHTARECFWPELLTQANLVEAKKGRKS